MSEEDKDNIEAYENLLLNMPDLKPDKVDVE